MSQTWISKPQIDECMVSISHPQILISGFGESYVTTS